MEHTFDKDYWEKHWQEFGGHGPDPLVNPYLSREVGHLRPGSALDAGCGEGAEAIWLAEARWDVTAADISTAALSRAAQRAATSAAAGRIDWVQADLSVWEPDRPFDLVMTNYAHPAIAQLAFYERISTWVAAGGTLLIVGHLHHHHDIHDHDHDHDDHDWQPPEAASVTAEAVTALLDPTRWDVVSVEEAQRVVSGGSGRDVELHDVIVRAERRQ